MKRDTLMSDTVRQAASLHILLPESLSFGLIVEQQQLTCKNGGEIMRVSLRLCLVLRVCDNYYV